MAQRYTEETRRVLFFAQHEACESGLDTIGVEHLLLGVAREDPGLLQKAVGEGTTQEVLKEAITRNRPPRTPIPLTQASMDLTREAKRVMKYSASEAARCEDRVIRPEHLLLGMMREEGCVAERMLTERGGNLKRMRNRMTEP